MNNSQFATDSRASRELSNQDALRVSEVLSLTPGRIRMRVSLASQGIESINLIVVSLKDQLPIEKVRTNPSIGSLTIFYHPQSLKATDIFDKLKELGVTFPEQSNQSLSFIPDNSKAAINVTQITQTLNQRFKQASNNIVDLGVLIPFSFALLAGRQLILKGWQLETIPWYVLAWYAFDSFMKLQNVNQDYQNP
ncbi:MAG: hypothetical protein QNJ08_20245 [Crocosphaera sp.]|nr:hypothetical protein [Crocosphaera sp.]